MRAMLLGVLLLVVGCGAHRQTRAETEEIARAKYAAANAEREQNRAARQAESERRHAEQAPHPTQADAYIAQQREVRAERVARTEAAAQDECAADRPERETEMRKRLDSIAKRDAVEDWETEHCKVYDNSKPVTRVVQDARGEYHARAGRDRGVDTVCEGKRPPPAGPIYSPPADVYSKIVTCRGRDVKVSAVAVEFWSR